MTLWLALPAVVALVVGLAARWLERPLRPAAATVSYTLLASIAAVAAASTVVMLATLTVARLPVLDERLSWCRSLGGDHQLPFWIATGVVAALGVMVFSTARTARRIVRTPRAGGHPEELVVLPTDQPTAYAVPGRPGQIVVSAGMLRRLDADERRVLLAHERSHLRRRHHRYLWTADLAAAALPLLRPLASSIRFATERWADEDAAREVGDRKLVARALSRAALAQSGLAPAGGLAVAGEGVAERVEAMLRDSPERRVAASALAAMGLAVIAGVASSTLQLHHIAVLAEHVCGLTGR